MMITALVSNLQVRLSAITTSLKQLRQAVVCDARALFWSVGALSFARYSELGMMCEWLPIGHFNLIIHGVYDERSSASVGSPVPTRAGE